MKAEIDGVKFQLRLDADGNPYVLKRFKQADSYGRWIWATVWANWHKGLPTGIRKRAIEAMGFTWRRDTSPAHWERCQPIQEEL